MAVNILSLDYLIADIVVELKDSRDLAVLVDKHEMIPGSKGRIDREGFAEFSKAIEGCPVTIFPGGSAANTLWTVGTVLGNKVSITFIGSAGGSAYSTMIRESLRKAEIKLIPECFPQEERGIKPETAVSFVVKFADGRRSIVTYPGNANLMINADTITDEIVQLADIVFVQGSLYRKFLPEVPDKLLKLAKEYNKEIWFSLPTHGWFVEEDREMLKQKIKNYASVVVGNEEELDAIYEDENIQKATEKLMQDFKGEAFITLGQEGFLIVDENGISETPAPEVDNIVSTLGAGDSAFAGFMIGKITGLDNKKTTKIVSALIREKLITDAARVPDPAQIIKDLL